MRKGIIYLVVFLLLLGAPAAVRLLQYYRLGGSQNSAPPQYDPQTILEVPTPMSTEYVDEPTMGQGMVLLDQSHDNSFTLDEISYLDGRLAARGVELVSYTGNNLATALRPANAFVVITPLTNFTDEEVQAVVDFVERGGRLLMVGDPTRFAVTVEEDLFSFTFTIDTDKIPLNSLANAFNIVFNGDYLYNTVENEGNFRNIILHQDGFAESGLTDGMGDLAFYGSHSLQVGSDASPLLTADDGTWSSATDRPGGLLLAATSQEGRVLAIGDVHFLTEPYYTVYDNSRFIARIADFLVESDGRGFVLQDFPYFYDNPVKLVYTGAPDLGPDAFDEVIALQDAFRRVDKTLRLAAEAEVDEDALYLGLYNQSEEVADILASAGISLTIDPPLPSETEAAVPIEGDEAGGERETDPSEEGAIRLIGSPVGNVQMSGTSLIILDESQGGRKVVVLAASSDGLENTVDRLLELIPRNADYALADCLIQEKLAFCPSGVSDEVVEAELVSRDAPEDEEEEEEDQEGEPDTGSGDLDAVGQGRIELGESVEGTLAEGEAHAWTFSDGPALVDIVVVSGDDLDAVLELYGPDNQLISSSDSGFTGEDEELLAVDIPDDDDYTVVVRDFFADGGDYTLSIKPAEEGGPGESGTGAIFLFADDDGEALSDGFTSVDALASLLSAYEVTTWVSTEDGPLEADSLDGYSLVIWDSGDYRDEDGFLDEDSAIIFDYLDNGGNLFITGSSPTILGATELLPISDVEITGDDPIILDGLNPGDVFELDQTYEAVSSELFEISEEDIIFFVRGPASQGAGNPVGLGAAEPDGNGKMILLLVPFTAMPADIQETLLGNLVTWFGLSDS